MKLPFVTEYIYRDDSGTPTYAAYVYNYMGLTCSVQWTRQQTVHIVFINNKVLYKNILSAERLEDIQNDLRNTLYTLINQGRQHIDDTIVYQRNAIFDTGL